MDQTGIGLGITIPLLLVGAVLLTALYVRRNRKRPQVPQGRTLYTITRRAQGTIEVVGSEEELAEAVGVVEAHSFLRLGVQPMGGSIHIQTERV